MSRFGRARAAVSPDQTATADTTSQVQATFKRSTTCRVLVRHGLIAARKRKRRRQDYKRWQRDAVMQLWQMYLTASVFLTDGTELKLVPWS